MLYFSSTTLHFRNYFREIEHIIWPLKYILITMNGTLVVYTYLSTNKNFPTFFFCNWNWFNFISGFIETPTRFGKVTNPEHFDATFFGFPPILANVTDPRHRMLLETAYECIVDAGYNPHELRGTKTGTSYRILCFFFQAGTYF